MKDVVKKGTAFILFDSPLDFQLISLRFIRMQSRCKEQFSHWPFSATRKKLMVEFWFSRIFLHFLILISLAITALIWLQKVSINSIAPLSFSAMYIFFILSIIHYGPVFYGDYLPKLATIIAEQEKLATEEDEIKKCRRTQYSIPTLTIIFYLWSKLAQIPMVSVNDHSSVLLNQLYGSDKDKLKQNLARIYKFSAIRLRKKPKCKKELTPLGHFFRN